MTRAQFLTSEPFIHSATLEFSDRELEFEYRDYSFRALRAKAQAALVLGLLLWFFYSLLEYFHALTSSVVAIWYIRAYIICSGSLVFTSTFYPVFERFNQQILIVAALTNAAALLVGIWLSPEIAASLFFPGLILTIFWTHNFSGIRFVFASYISIVILIGYNLPFFHPRPILELVSTNFYILASIAIAVCASYLTERQSRFLFLHARELDGEREHQLSRALHDSLTGLPNRELLDDRLEQAISQSNRDERICAGLFVDLDGFKLINDDHGHSTGDLLLKEVTARFKSVIRDADTLSRIGGDEFFILARDIQSMTAAQLLADKLLHQLQLPFILGGSIKLPGVTASIGACLFPYKHCTPIDIINQADQAMYKVKRGDKAGVAFADIRKQAV